MRGSLNRDAGVGATSLRSMDLGSLDADRRRVAGGRDTPTSDIPNHSVRVLVRVIRLVVVAPAIARQKINTSPAASMPGDLAISVRQAHSLRPGNDDTCHMGTPYCSRRTWCLPTRRGVSQRPADGTKLGKRCGLRPTGTTDCSCYSACSVLVWAAPGRPRSRASLWPSKLVSCVINYSVKPASTRSGPDKPSCAAKHGSLALVTPTSVVMHGDTSRLAGTTSARHYPKRVHARDTYLKTR